MAGGLVHISAAILSAVIVHMIHFKWEYSYAMFIGNLLPDALKFGLTALKQETLEIFHVDKSDAFYRFLSANTSDWSNWFALGFFVLAVVVFLYHFHVIKKKRMEEYSELYGFLLAGIVIHLVMDIFVIEKGIWW